MACKCGSIGLTQQNIPAMPASNTDHTFKPRVQHFIGHNGIDIVADVGGSDDGLPVILLHGGGQTRHSWKRLAQVLIKNGCRVTNVDQRGHGDSAWAADGDYDMSAFVGDLLNIIATQPSPPMVVGASMGGVAALLAVGDSPTPIARGVALIDIVPKVEAAGGEAILKFMGAHPEGFATLDDAADTVSAYLPHRPRPATNDGLMKNLRKGEDGRLHWHWDPKIIHGQRKDRHEEFRQRMEVAARNLRVPTLLVRGGKSDLVSLEGAKHFLELVPGASFVDVQGAAHMVAGDMNDVFNKAIVDFIKEKLQR